MKKILSLSALATSLLLFSTIASAESCPPSGSWSDTCTASCKQNDTVLAGFCNTGSAADGKGSTIPAALDISTCSEDVSNCKGFLTCGSCSQ